MKFIWEEKDVEPGWRVMCGEDKTHECIIGYRHSVEAFGPYILTLISLEDGLQITSFDLKEKHDELGSVTTTAAAQMAAYLNENGYVPKTLTRWG